MTWNVVGQALVVVTNELLAWAWTLFHLPVLSPPSAEFLGSEQLLAGILLWVWATKEDVALPAQPPVAVPPAAVPHGQQGQ